MKTTYFLNTLVSNNDLPKIKIRNPTGGHLLILKSLTVRHISPIKCIAAKNNHGYTMVLYGHIS